MLQVFLTFEYYFVLHLSHPLLIDTTSQMSGSTGQSAHSRLLALERSDASISDSLTELAAILNVDLEALKTEFCGYHENPVVDGWSLYNLPPTPVFAPKEEWALRWLLKKPMSKANYPYCYPDLWLLFYHLLRRVPVKRAALLLREHAWLEKAGDCILKIQRDSPFSGDDDGTLPDRILIYFCILRSLYYCLEYGDAQMRLAMVLPTLSAAKILGSIVQFDGDRGDTSRDHFDLKTTERPELLISVLQIWDLRDRGSTFEENLAFNKYCLVPFIDYFLRAKIWDEECYVENAHVEVQRLIAAYAILPTRQLFSPDLASIWKLDQDPLETHKVTASAKALTELLFPNCVVVDRRQLRHEVGEKQIKQVILVIFELALKALEQENSHKSPAEQRWIQLLLLWLAQAPRLLPQVPRDPKDPTFDPWSTKVHFSTVNSMLGMLLNQGVPLPLPIVAHLFELFPSDHLRGNFKLRPLKSLMETGANAFVPRSGLISASRHSREIFEMALDQPRDGWDYKALDLWAGIFGDMMTAYAHGRQLPVFLDLWMTNLRVLGESFSVIDCAPVMAALTEVARGLDISALLVTHIDKTVQALQASDEAYFLSLVIILQMLIAGRELDVIVSHELIQRLEEGIRGAIQGPERYGRISGWLWRLHCRLLPYIPASSLMLIVEFHQHHYRDGVVSQAAQLAIPPSDSLYFSTMEPFADIEALHWLMAAAALNPTPDTRGLVDRETKAFASWPNLLVHPLSPKGFRPGSHGRLRAVKDMTEALIGVFLRHSSLICSNPRSAGSLLRHFPLQQRLGSIFVQNSLDVPDNTLFQTAQPALQVCEQLDPPEFAAHMDDLEQYPPELLTKSQRKKLAVAKEQEMDTTAKLKATARDSDSVYLHRWGVAGMQEDCLDSLEQATISKEATAAKCNRFPETNHFSDQERTLLGAMLYKGFANGIDVQKLGPFLCEEIARSGSPKNFCLNVDCIIIILNKHASAVSQWLIDSLLAALVDYTASAPLLTTDRSIIFDRLCRLVGTILSRHRVRLGGRSHLLIPVLLGLLRCLFVPNITHSSTASERKFNSTLPEWLVSEKVYYEGGGVLKKVPSNQLPKECGTNLARLLSSIADPSPSAVKTSKTNTLNDETRRARRIAGEYMQYVIAEYTRFCLEGSILPETKEALMPGLYKVLDGMDRDVMRAMNARLDGSQKAIWRALYQDWERFGKWDGK